MNPEQKPSNEPLLPEIEPAAAAEHVLTGGAYGEKVQVCGYQIELREFPFGVHLAWQRFLKEHAPTGPKSDLMIHAADIQDRVDLYESRLKILTAKKAKLLAEKATLEAKDDVAALEAKLDEIEAVLDQMRDISVKMADASDELMEKVEDRTDDNNNAAALIALSTCHYILRRSAGKKLPTLEKFIDGASLEDIDNALKVVVTGNASRRARKEEGRELIADQVDKVKEALAEQETAGKTGDGSPVVSQPASA